ncbi:SCAN domain-containing protein 3 [Trichonephila clavipes]|nr:SCAN domain-containing protein 3 [Trichonephila clavipes]
MVKIKNSWSVCPEFEPGTAEDPPCRSGRWTLNMSRLKRPPIGVVWCKLCRSYQSNSEVDNDDVQELLDPHNQELTNDELIGMSPSQYGGYDPRLVTEWIREDTETKRILNEISEKVPILLDYPSASSEMFVAVDDNVCTPPIMADKDSLEFVQSSKNIIDSDSDDEN